MLALGLQLGLSYILIRLVGIMGVGVSILLAQGSLALALFCGFLLRERRVRYQTDAWHFQPKLFWHVTKKGYMRASNRLITLVAWAIAAQVILVKGGEYVVL